MDRQQVIDACYLVPGQTWPTELGWLYDELRHSKTHAEIGTFCGRSLLASCGGMWPGSVVYSIDDMSEWPNPEWVDAVRGATMRLIPAGVTVHFLRMNSIDAARELRGVKFDSIFIDGCHEYAECGADIQAWSSLVRPGGLICGHDYWPADAGVMDAVNKFVPDFKCFSGTRIWWTTVVVPKA